VHRDKFLIIKQTRCTNFSNLFLEWNSTCFEQFLCPSSGVFHCTHSNGICLTCLLTACEQDRDETPWSSIIASCQQTRMTYTIAVRTVKNSWWWTEELFETCRISFVWFQFQLNALSLVYYISFIFLYMFRGILCSSSGGSIVYTQHLVLYMSLFLRDLSVHGHRLCTERSHKKSDI